MAVYEINNIIIDKGTYFEATFNLFNPDSSVTILSGLTTAYARIRKHPQSENYEEFSKTITIGTGTIKLSLSDEQTSRLTIGRNYFDVILTLYGKKIKVIKGTAIVEDSASLYDYTSVPSNAIEVMTQSLNDLIDVDISGNNNKYILMYDSTTGKWKNVNPDEVLIASSTTETTQPGLPIDFIDALDVNLDNKIDLDAGEF